MRAAAARPTEGITPTVTPVVTPTAAMTVRFVMTTVIVTVAVLGRAGDHCHRDRHDPRRDAHPGMTVPFVITTVIVTMGAALVAAVMTVIATPSLPRGKRFRRFIQPQAGTCCGGGNPADSFG